MRGCWNRQTGTFEVRVSNDVWVQVPFLAPRKKSLLSTDKGGFFQWYIAVAIWYTVRRMIYLLRKHDIISVPSYAKRISSAKQISYPQGISSVTEGNGYHCKKPLLSGRQKRFLSWRREWDSNPRCVAASLVFKTSSLNRSDISPNTAKPPCGGFTMAEWEGFEPSRAF